MRIKVAAIVNDMNASVKGNIFEVGSGRNNFLRIHNQFQGFIRCKKGTTGVKSYF